MNLKKNVLTGLIILCVGFVSNLVSQDLNQTIPLDPNVKTGTLSNGMKYYIRKNAKPEKRVELRLAIAAGAVLEDDDQQGLAHFTEHMAFNGSKNFKKNDLVSYLQTVGVKFGADLNAYTSFDETVYILPIPSDKPEIVEKGFLVLEDWANGLLFEDAEIDKERGVITEEWRTRTGAQERMNRVVFPKLFKNSKYSDRLPIGKMDIIKNFKYDAIKRFYKDWYRPDLMAVAVVGDIDIAEMEKQIQNHFGRIAKASNPRKKEFYDVPDHKETLIAIASDKENPFTQVQVIYKHPEEKIKTLGDYRNSLMYSLYGEMLNARFEELSQSGEPPFLGAFAFFGSYLGPKNVYYTSAQVGETGLEKGLKTILAENKRVYLHGFTASELERAKQNMLNNYEKAFKEKDKTNSENYVDEYVQNFLTGNAAPGIAYELEQVKKMLPTIQIAEINTLPKKWMTAENRVVVITASEKEGVKIPTEVEVQKMLQEADASSPVAYEDKTITEPLMAEIPKAGTTTKETKLEQVAATELVLSNGVRVVLKPTTFKDDEILMTAYSNGGTSIVSDADYKSAQFASQIINESGVRNFSPTDLQKLLTGKTVSVNPYLGQLSEGFNGNAAPKDLETMLQLTNLYFTAPRKDADAFKSFVNKNKAQMKNLMNFPQFVFFDQTSKIMSQNHPRGGGFPTEADFDAINLDKAYEIYKDRFADASDFNFFFVGNFDVEKIKPLLETYLGSLPSTKRVENFKDLGIRPPSGVVEKSFEKGKDEKSQVMISFNGEMKNDKDAYLLRSYAEALTIKLIESLREEKGGVYGTSAQARVSKYPYKNYSVSVNFTCAPENVQKLTDAVNEEIKKIQKNGPTVEDLNKVKETQRREIEKNSKENRYWLGGLQRAYYEQTGLENLNQEVINKRIDALTAKDIKKVANKYTTSKNVIRIVMKPEPKPEETGKVEEKTEQSATGSNDTDPMKEMTADKVIDKYLAAIGGKDKLREVTALKANATMDVMGTVIEMSVSKKAPNMLLMIQKMPQGEVKTIFDGNKGVSITPMGKEALPEEAIKGVRNQATMFEELDYKNLGIKAELVKVDKVNDKNAFEIKFTDQAGNATSKWYDANTGLIVKMLAPQGQEFYYNEYEEVKGIKFPKTTSMKMQGMEISIKTTTEVNPTLDNAIFKVE